MFFFVIHLNKFNFQKNGNLEAGFSGRAKVKSDVEEWVFVPGGSVRNFGCFEDSYTKMCLCLLQQFKSTHIDPLPSLVSCHE